MKAQSDGVDPRLRRRAALGALLAAIEFEDADAEDLLAELNRAELTDPTEVIVLADRQLHYETRFGKRVDLQRGREASQLLRFVPDPVVRASFRNVFGYALASTANWVEAAALTDEQLGDAERCRLDFVIPHALAIQAMSATGRREYDGSAALLTTAEKLARATSDAAALQMVTGIRMRTLIAQAAFDSALAQSDVDISNATKSFRGELLSVKALALAASGHVEPAREMAELGLRESIGVEAVVNGRCALAVAALNQNEHDVGREHASQALDRAIAAGMIESLVCAYRGCPQLLVCLLEKRELHEPVSILLQRAGDSELMPSARPPGDNSVLSLSPREKEVLALLARGMSNAAIGKELFISPVTVKVHVRHIFDKLGVKSRAAAALRAAQLGRDG
jgi:DNA-binding NarL/FixJ family response regulator